MPDTGAVEITLAAYTANILPGDPVWLMLVGPPSSGKGEILGALGGIPHLHSAATLTEAALLSGVKSSERSDDAQGGLLREMGEFGILLLKDFTSILSMSRETRTTMLAALREIYDGAWTRRLGVDGGRCLAWHGKMGLLGGVTQALDSHHAVMAEMGPRFMLYRLPPTDARKQAHSALSHSGIETEMREELREEVKRFFGGLNLTGRETTRPENTEEETDRLVLLVEFASYCRSAVERHPYTREIVLVPQPEAPARLVRSAAQLLAGLAVIGVQPPRRRELLSKVILDCIPPVRRCVIDYLAGVGKAHTTETITDSTGLPRQTLRTALQDLACHGIVNQSGSGWQLATAWREHIAVAYPSLTRRSATIGGARAGIGDD
jgi:hypothetical protein